MPNYCACGAVVCARGLCRRHYDEARRQDPETLEKLKAANRRYFRSPKGLAAMARCRAKAKALKAAPDGI